LSADLSFGINNICRQSEIYRNCLDRQDKCSLCQVDDP
jgi:hypothetical protein